MIGENNGAAVVEVEAAVEGGVQAEITGILDGLGGLKKVKGLTPTAREAAEGPLREQLREALVSFGQPVARGNTVYAVTPDGELLTIDLTPKTLVRL